MERPTELATAFKALGDPRRLKIMDLLRASGKSCCGVIQRDERGLYACDIDEAMEIAPSATGSFVQSMIH